MGNKQIRLGQLIAPFGPGSLYTDRRGVPHVICGLDFWFMRWDQTLGMVPCDNRAEFERAEPRLSALLHVNRFCAPPDFRHAISGSTPPPNALLNVPAQRFPRWYRHTRTGEMRRFSLDAMRIENPPGGGRWQPVRFIAVCDAGHLCEFPWKEWIGCSCPGDGGLILTDRGGSELSTITIRCGTCPDRSSGQQGRSLSGTTVRPPKAADGEAPGQSAFRRAGILCSGDRPWLGEGACEPGCNHDLIGALINQTNLYFPRTISAIALPELQPMDEAVANLKNEIELDTRLGVARTLWSMGDRDGTVALVQVGLMARDIECDPTKVGEALESIFDPAGSALPAGAASPVEPESTLVAFRRAEFNIIRQEVNDPAHVPHLRVIPAAVPGELTPWFAKVNLVERLRETRAFFGFDRLEQDRNILAGMPETAMRQLFLFPPRQQQDCWLPAIEVFGEGIYVELSELRIARWQEEQAAWLENRLDDAYITRLEHYSFE